MSDPVTVFIISRNRPLYLWACLDSFYTNTKYPCNFIIADNCSTDPLVKEVINGFKRREMFYDVILGTENYPHRLRWLLKKYKQMLGKYFVFIESDTLIMRNNNEICWLNRFCLDMEENNMLGAVGAHVFEEDYVSEEKAKRVIGRDLNKYEHQQLWIAEQRRMKTFKPEDEICYRFSPAGRIVMVRTETLKSVIHSRNNGTWFKGHMEDAGYQVGIDTRVLYRHLSILNIYDYPNYHNLSEEKEDPSAWNYFSVKDEPPEYIL